MKKSIWLILVAIGCTPTQSYNAELGQQWVDSTILSHGSHRLLGQRVSFDFRDRSYAVERSTNGYRYFRSWTDDSLGQVDEVLINSTDFFRKVNGDTVSVSQEWSNKYRESINSVLYFFQIPYILNDGAVNKGHVGQVRIKGEPYEEVRITFGEEGGGEDFTDVFHYWIHSETHKVDYMAYSYERDGGGVRFRVAMNRKNIGGVWFQDYVNYKAPKRAALSDLPRLYEEEKLDELSKIINESIRMSPLNP